MAIRRPAEVLWNAWIGKPAPRTVREQVDLVGLEEAARAAGVKPTTVRGWIRAEEKAMPKGVADAVKEYGGVDAAAKAAGVRPRTLKDWLRGEQRGRQPGKRQSAHIEKLTRAARDKHVAGLRPRGNQAKLQNAVLKSPQARQKAMSTRRAARMSSSGAHLSIKAQVTVDTGKRQDTRWRDINMNFRDDVMAEPTRAFLNGNDQGAVDKVSDAFGRHYAPGTGWNFAEIRSMSIGEYNPGNGGTFPDPDHY